MKMSDKVLRKIMKENECTYDEAKEWFNVDQVGDDLQRRILARLRDSHFKNRENCAGVYEFIDSLVKPLEKMEKIADKTNIRTPEMYHTAFNEIDVALAQRFPVKRVKASKKKTDVKLAATQYRNAFKVFLSYLDEKKGRHTWFISHDPDMVAMMLSDLADHVRLAVALYSGDVKAIWNTSGMDTASREEIPESVWDYVVRVT